MNTDRRVGRLLVRWQQLRQQGRAPSLEELCAECPELHEAVGRQIANFTAQEAGKSRSDLPIDATPDDDDDAEEATQLTARFSSSGSTADADDAEHLATLKNLADKPIPPINAPPSGLSHVQAMHGYRLLERLGGGTFGEVYRALSSGGVAVAVKEIRYSPGHPQSKRELEALELIKGLRHPYLLALHDFWVENDRLYMAMELADKTLAQLAEEGASGGLFQSEVMQIFEEAAEALDFLHQERVLHRDIKPANILLLGGHAKLADLGLAKFNPEEVAFSQTVAGTPSYMAPETFKNEFRAESDQYALALCYTEVRLGRRLCEGTNLPAAIAWHLYTAPNLEGLRPYEQKAVGRALSKNPAERFPSCQEFVHALQEPKLPPRPGMGWKPIVALFLLLLAIPALAAAVWLLLPGRDKATGPTSEASTPSAKSPVTWVPEQNGFLMAPEAQIRADEVSHKHYYDRILKKIGGRDAAFRLIHRADPNDPQTFYMMEDKVSNGLFKAAASDGDFQKQLAELRAQYPTLEWDRWRLGGRRNGTEDVGANDDDLPVLRVNVMEAYCFARWVGGNLPTVQQWDRASGKGSGAKTIYQNPDLPLQPGDVAVNRKAEGPMPVGAAKRDVSPVFECRDMAGDGREWTRNLDPGDSFPPAEVGKELQVILRGQSYYSTVPYSFGTPTNYADFTQADPAIGFRVVVEP